MFLRRLASVGQTGFSSKRLDSCNACVLYYLPNSSAHRSASDPSRACLFIFHLMRLKGPRNSDFPLLRDQMPTNAEIKTVLHLLKASDILRQSSSRFTVHGCQQRCRNIICKGRPTRQIQPWRYLVLRICCVSVAIRRGSKTRQDAA